MYQSQAVDHFVHDLPGWQQEIIQYLRDILLSSASALMEEIKYKIPFYSYKGDLCYINPQKDQVVLGFTKGAQLLDEPNILEGDQKEVRHYVIRDFDAIDEDDLRIVIQEAILLNES